MAGVDLIWAERFRQIHEEHYNAYHDHGHADQLAAAGATYALPEKLRPSSWARTGIATWPWTKAAWKPTPDDRVRELVKAGALIAAAIDALLDTGEPQ